TITDVVQIRTFAEEVYTQIVVGDVNSERRSIAVSVPFVLVTLGIIVFVALRLEKSLPSLDRLSTAPYRFPVRWFRVSPVILLVVIFLGASLVPLASLIWKTGQLDRTALWSPQVFRIHLETVWRARWPLVVQSLLVALATGIVAAVVSLVWCWH